MDTNEKLDKIIELLETEVEAREGLQDQLDELREAIANISLPGRDYDTFDIEES